jgi:hypothetical protein
MNAINHSISYGGRPLYIDTDGLIQAQLILGPSLLSSGDPASFLNGLLDKGDAICEANYI